MLALAVEEKSKQIVSQIINQLEAIGMGIVAYAGSAFSSAYFDYSVAKMFCKHGIPKMVSSQEPL
jgi:hypothetical protein